jgi:hypothetical protein
MNGFIHCVMDGLRFTILSETPCAEPHAGCCGGCRLETSGYPIMHNILLIGMVNILILKPCRYYEREGFFCLCCTAARNTLIIAFRPFLRNEMVISESYEPAR